ncbi:MAG TPA: ATP-binding protein [Lachnospiraceae bacterium]
MPLRNFQYDEILRDYDKKQFRHKHNLDKRIQKAYREIPRLKEIDEEIASFSIQKAKFLLFSEGEPFDLHKKIEKLSKEKEELLFSHGFPKDYLQMHYDCSLCKDTGFIDNKKCSCFQKAAVDLLYTQSNLANILEKENFNLFSFDYYSDTIVNEITGQTVLDVAKHAVGISKQFVANFDKKFENLIFFGNTGVGKTFLSHCIAKELIDSGHSVIYFSAYDLISLLEKNAFSKNKEFDNNTYVLDCDLLIIDDLGTELTNSFVGSQLFMCLNERIQNQKSTIISTNLRMDEFSERYSERVFSRISSHYTMLKLFGDDIRLQKRLSGGK